MTDLKTTEMKLNIIRIMKHLIVSSFVVLMCSCAGNPPEKPLLDKNMQQVIQVPNTAKTNHTSIGSSGFSIELPEDFKIDSTIGERSSVYYFQPKDTNAIHGEAGIYIGKHPQDADPTKDNYKREFSSVFMGQMVKWTEYKMNPDTQRETFVALNDSIKIHCWCYSDREDDLEKLFGMINTINH